MASPTRTYILTGRTPSPQRPAAAEESFDFCDDVRLPKVPLLTMAKFLLSHGIKHEELASTTSHFAMATLAEQRQINMEPLLAQAEMRSKLEASHQKAATKRTARTCGGAAAAAASPAQSRTPPPQRPPPQRPPPTAPSGSGPAAGRQPKPRSPAVAGTPQQPPVAVTPSVTCSPGSEHGDATGLGDGGARGLGDGGARALVRQAVEEYRQSGGLGATEAALLDALLSNLGAAGPPTAPCGGMPPAVAPAGGGGSSGGAEASAAARAAAAKLRAAGVRHRGPAPGRPSTEGPGRC